MIWNRRDLQLSAALLASLAVICVVWITSGKNGDAEQISASPDPAVQSTRTTPPVTASTGTAIVNPTATPTPKISKVINPRAGTTSFHAGVSVLVYSDGRDFGEKSPQLLDRLAELNVNSVSLVFPIFQANWRASEVFKDPAKTPTDQNIRIFVREAHKRGFTVMLRPILDEASLVSDGKWRGQLNPSDLNGWFNSYSSLMLSYAKLAEEEKIAILNIGTEFVSLESQSDHWRTLITSVRVAYRGQVTYSANWDVKAPAFIAELDFPSVDAYYPLDAPIGASIASLVSSWQPWVADLSQKGYDPSTVVFTEVGVLPRQGAHQRPWNYLLNSAADYEGQARYYQATCQVFAPLITGIYWWQVDLTLPDPDKPDLGFSPLGKPAENALPQCVRPD